MFTLYHTSGFYFTPLTKGVLGSLVLSSVAFILPLQANRHWFTYAYSSLFEKYNYREKEAQLGPEISIINSQREDFCEQLRQFFSINYKTNKFLRFLANRTVFLDPKDLICAAILLYHFRIFERRFGSRKYASYLISTFALACGLELVAVNVLHHLDLPITLDPLPSGPQGVVFALFVPYFCDIPRVAVTHMLGVPVTGKSLTYIIGLQMASSSPESMLLAVCGVVSGLLYQKNILYIKGLVTIPAWLGSMSARCFGWLVNSPPPVDTNVPMGATLELQRTQQMEVLEQQLIWAQMEGRPQNGGFGFFGNHNGPVQNANIPVAPPVVAAPSDDQVQRLVEMGFNRDSVRNALRVTSNDITMATNILLHES